jgi:23S rRNA (cytosine1962-C5)-methyltransferase
VYADALHRRPAAAAGARADLLARKQGRLVARGFYDPNSALAFRVCTVEPNEALTDAWAAKRMDRAVRLRQTIFKAQTTGFRLFNGEGDGLPGLICDIYGNSAVLQLDGAGPTGFWDHQGVAEWLTQALPLDMVYLRGQSRQGGKGQILIGDLPAGPISFLENNLRFTVDVIQGQKTGFYLDQRENRQHIRTVADNRRVLNIFGYTGGFSIYAGSGGASQVTTVDLAGPALDVANQHWRINDLAPAIHRTVQADAFDFLEKASAAGDSWGLVIVDPPSFASSQGAVKKAVSAYERLFAAATAVTSPDGLLAVASCSSHIDLTTFLALCETAISRARRRATVLRINGQPPDHPSPLPFSEFRYLKFVLVRIE